VSAFIGSKQNSGQHKGRWPGREHTHHYLP